MAGVEADDRLEIGPPRASSKASVPPKQKPIAATRAGSTKSGASRRSGPACPIARAWDGEAVVYRELADQTQLVVRVLDGGGAHRPSTASVSRSRNTPDPGGR